ncbi:MAG: hypothetical protein ACRYFX_09065 [Janthinobacterium lividum]
MLKNYLLLLGLSGALLAGCSRSERPAETADAPTAAVPKTPLPATAPVAVEPVAPTALPPGPVPAPVAPTQRSAGTQPAALPHPLAVATAKPTAQVQAPLASDSANMAELRAFMQASEPAVQTFAVRPGRDTMLVAAQGTQLLLAADAWDVPAGSGPVEIKIQEFYQMPDIMLAGLTTTSGSELLETGGMVRVEATANGQAARLRPGAAVHLRLPTKRRQPGMQLFVSPGRPSSTVLGPVGDTGPDLIDWQLPPAPGLALALPPARPAKVPTWSAKPGRRSSSRRSSGWRGRKGHRMPSVHPQYNARYLEVPEYASNEARALKTLAHRISYAPAVQARLRKALRTGRHMSKQELAELRQASTQYGERVLRLVHASFQVDTLGRATRLVLAPGTDAELGAAVLTALGQLGAWQPALMPRLPQLDSLTTVPAFGQVKAYFSVSGKVYVEDSVSWNRATTRALRDSTTKAQAARYYAQRRNYYVSLTPQQKRVLDSTAQVRLAAERANLYQRLGKRESVAGSQELLYYELSAQNLGWINCDRFLNPGPRIEFVVTAALRNTIVTLVFRDIRAVMSSSNIGSRTTFRNVPTGPATVVALRREKGITYLARHEVVVSTKGLDQLTFRPVTPDELRTELASLH